MGLNSPEFLFKIAHCEIIENTELNQAQAALRIFFKEMQRFIYQYLRTPVLGKAENT